MSTNHDTETVSTDGLWFIKPVSDDDTDRLLYPNNSSASRPIHSMPHPSLKQPALRYFSQSTCCMIMDSHVIFSLDLGYGTEW